jgi:hypothetical protein
MLSVVVPAVIVLGIGAMFLAFIRWAKRESEGEDPRWGMPGEIALYSTANHPPGNRVYVIPTVDGLLLRSSDRQEADWERLYPWYRVHVDIVGDGVRLGGPFGVVLARPTDGTALPTVLDRMGPRRTPPPDDDNHDA